MKKASESLLILFSLKGAKIPLNGLVLDGLLKGLSFSQGLVSGR